MPPEICLGSAQFGLPYGVTNTAGIVDEQEISFLLSEAASAGLSFVDTAQAYGESESILGRNKCPGVNYRFISKFPKQSKTSFSVEDCYRWDKEFQRTLRLLGVSSLDSFLLHSPKDLLKPGGAFLEQWLLALRDSGRVKRLGVSIYDATDLESVPTDLLNLVQLPLSLYDQRLLSDGTISYLSSQGCAIHARSIYLQGLLLTPSGLWPDWIAPSACLHHARLLQFASEQGCSLIDCALGFARAQSQLEAVVIGLCSLRQLKQLLQAWQLNSPWINDDWKRWAIQNPDILDPRRWPR